MPNSALNSIERMQIVQLPEPANPQGPSRLGIAILLGAGLLLVATWHKLTSRCCCRPGNRCSCPAHGKHRHSALAALI